MAIVLIRCKQCGGPAAPTGKLGEYNCEHCGTFSELVRPIDGTVISDSKTHHCPMCGRAVKLQRSFKCTECGSVDFCQNCVSSLPNFGVERFVCRACISEKGWVCQICGSFGIFDCANCGSRSCQQHIDDLFGIQHERRDGNTVEFYNCANCGRLCIDCLQVKRGLFSTKYLCPKCGTQIHSEIEPPRLSSVYDGFQTVEAQGRRRENA